MKRPTLALTRPLLDWLRTDPTWPDLPWPLRTLLAWRARWGSMNLRLSDAQPASTAPLRPLFIAGPWRSGSTVMHELLAAALGWPTPLSWQCMDPAAFALQRAPRAGISVARPMDGLELGALSPQEDEFALVALGVDSAYRAFWQPWRLAELHATLDPAHWRADDAWLPRWERFARAVLGPRDQQGCLLLKSPNHSPRLPAFLQRFPNAQVVWMLRDAEAVYWSNRKMWSQMFALHGLGQADDDALDTFLAQALQSFAQVLGTVATASRPGQFALCAQERLLAQPQAEVSRVLAELKLHPQADGAPLQQALERTARGRVERYSARKLPVAVAAAVHQLDTVQRRVLV